MMIKEEASGLMLPLCIAWHIEEAPVARPLIGVVLFKKNSVVLPLINDIFNFYTFFIFLHLKHKPKVSPEIQNAVF